MQSPHSIIEYPESENNHKDIKSNLQEYVPYSVVQMLHENCQALHCDHFPRETVLVSNSPPGEEPSPSIQPKPPLKQVLDETIYCSCISRCSVRISKNVFSQACHVILHSMKISPPISKSQYISLKD